MIRFRTLGGVELKGPEGHSIQSVLARPKLLGLLAYLAAASPRGFHRRDTLLALLWEDLDEDRLRRVEAPPGEDRIDLERAISLLPAGYRTVLILHDIEGFKHASPAAMRKWESLQTLSGVIRRRSPTSSSGARRRRR